jgi:hypothetical protein
VGAHGVCADDGTGPERLRGAGLTLPPGGTTRVRADTAGIFSITIVAPAAGMTATDLTLEVFTSAESNQLPF